VKSTTYKSDECGDLENRAAEELPGIAPSRLRLRLGGPRAGAGSLVLGLDGGRDVRVQEREGEAA
jgi:hypothetical protein